MRQDRIKVQRPRVYHPVGVSDAEVESTLRGEDMVWSLWRHRAGVFAHRLHVASVVDKTKGIICDVWPDEDMPVDADGNRVELITDALSTLKRMNPPRCTEQYLNAASRDVSKKLREMTDQGKPMSEVSDYLLSFYRIASPRMIALVSDNNTVNEKHLRAVLDNGIYLWQPTDNEVDPMDVIRQINRHYPPTFGPVTYRGMGGEMRRTSNNILVGSMYIMLLEKTGRNWAGVASSKLSHFGTPAKLTTADRHSAPGRNQPIRFGESEFRLFVAMVGGEASAELLDRTNNPVVRKVIQERILREPKPTDIDVIVDREQYPSGNGRVLSLVRHFGECAGWRFKREVIHND